MLSENKIVRGVWYGDRLTPIQRLCIRSYQKQGHEFHLYVGINPPVGIPDGTKVHSMFEVVPVGTRQRFTCDSHFSDYFRVKVIELDGGWYADMDTLCLKPFDFSDPYCFISEFPDGLVNGCIFKAPKDAPFLKEIIRRINEMDTLHPVSWISVGPQMFRDCVPEFFLGKYVKPPYVFDGLSPDDLMNFTRPLPFSFGHAHAAHLRTSYWTTRELDPDAAYDEKSKFEQLKRDHGVDLASTVQPYTMAAPERVGLIIELCQCADRLALPGVFVECGCWNGGLSAVLARFGLNRRQVFVFDSFKGLPPPSVKDTPSANGVKATECDQCVGSLQKFCDIIELVGGNPIVIAGWFAETFPAFPTPPIALLLLDSDWYESEKLCLEKFYDSVVPGGFIYFDDWFYWPGSQQAARDFFDSRGIVATLHQVGHSAWMQKGTIQ